jgi:hypothetical protein
MMAASLVYNLVNYRLDPKVPTEHFRVSHKQKVALFKAPPRGLFFVERALCAPAADDTTLLSADHFGALRGSFHFRAQDGSHLQGRFLILVFVDACA